MSRGWGIATSEPEDDAVDLDLRRVVTLLPGQVRQGERRRPMQHVPIEVETRAVTRAVEALLALVECDRAAQVRAVDREDVDLSLVLDHEAAEGEVAGCVVTAAVGHDEGRVRAGRGFDLDRLSVGELVDWLGEGDRQRTFLLPLGWGGPQVNEDRRESDDDCGGEQSGHLPGYESPACEPWRRSGICHPPRILKLWQKSA